nr:hypothetical protein [Microbacterium testaceum]
MHALPLPRRPHRHDLLDSSKELAVHQRFVSSRVDLVFESSEPEVVRILKKAKQLVVRELLGWPAPRSPRLQTTQEQLIPKFRDAVLAGCIEFERELDEVSTVRIEVDGADLPILDAYADVDVAERRHENGAALLGLLPQLVRDVCTVLGGPVLIEGRQDALHQLAHGGAIDALRRRNQSDAAALQLSHSEGFVVTVAVEPREFVDDDVVDVALPLDAFEHLLKLWTPGCVRSRATGLDVLFYDLQSHLLNLALTRLALGWERNPLRVVVGSDLLPLHRTTRGWTPLLRHHLRQCAATSRSHLGRSRSGEVGSFERRDLHRACCLTKIGWERDCWSPFSSRECGG